jgi:CSLREA domain-containing protein
MGNAAFRLLGATLLLPAATLCAATITVNSTADTAANDGLCTLREAINAAKNNTASGAAAGECVAGSGADTIAFNISGTGCDGSGVCTITPGAALPFVGDSVTFDGYTQTGASVNTLAAGTNAVLKVVLSGAGGAGDCLSLGSHDTVRGLVINGCDTAIKSFSGDNKVLGCFIGVNAAGTAAVANGVGLIFISSANVTIGGTDPADRNLISGNGSGGGGAIQVASGSGFVIQGNLIGTNAAGSAAIPNAYSGAAVTVNSAVNTLIGGSAAGAGNVVSGNSGGGIETGGTAVTVQGNLIGTTASGAGSLANTAYGVSLTGAATVGGVNPGEGNVIAHNQLGGVWIAASTAGAKVQGNSIHDNGSGGHLGIDNLPLGVSLNDAGDATSPQNFPEITGVTASSVSGTLNSKANTTFDIDVYASPACGPSGYGEGQTYLGSTQATTNAGGNASFTATVTVPAGQKVTATATGTATTSTTSEFSQCEGLKAAFLDADPASGATSDGNGVFEPGETATIRPNWTNPTQVALALTSTASSLTGPGGASYSIVDSADDYGSILPGHTQNCSATGNCFTMFVSDPSNRPSTHWDAQFTETLSSSHGVHTWKLHLGDSFTDVPRSETFYRKIETVFHAGITLGCTATQYCPNDLVPRSQMAIFLARGIALGGGGIPTSGTVGAQAYNCTAGGTSLFSDVAPTDLYCKHVHFIAAQNVTLGCATGKFCPTGNVSRIEMAAFIAKAIKAPAGGAAIPVTYGPDPVTGISYSCNPASPSNLFFDVPATDPFCKHVHYLRATGVIAGCGVTSYCPTQSVKRDEMAKFLSNAFAPLLYGP